MVRGKFKSRVSDIHQGFDGAHQHRDQAGHHQFMGGDYHQMRHPMMGADPHQRFAMQQEYYPQNQGGFMQPMHDIYRQHPSENVGPGGYMMAGPNMYGSHMNTPDL